MSFGMLLLNLRYLFHSMPLPGMKHFLKGIFHCGILHRTHITKIIFRHALSGLIPFDPQSDCHKDKILFQIKIDSSNYHLV